MQFKHFFSIIGKVVKGSGFEDIMYQVNLCSTGGIKGVLSGKHYNRSWSVHECLAEAIQRLLIRQTSSLHIDNAFSESLENVKDRESCNKLLKSADFTHFKKNYDVLVKEYEKGTKGKTGQYWIFYLSLVKLLHTFHYSINVNDYELRLNCWKKIVTICFSTNKRNYARFGSYYVMMLENLPKTHPGAKEELSEKGVSVRRNKFGIGQSIDGAGEQTFMRSAKTIGGIENFTTQAGTYDKWVLSRPFQAKLVEALLENVGLDEKDSYRKFLRKSEITKSEKRISNVVEVLTDTFMNPFSDEFDSDKLYNITSGSHVRSDIADCLLNIEERGKILHNNFIKRLDKSKQLNLFWDPIKKEDWHGFSENEKRTKFNTKGGKTIEVNVQRDILGFLLAKSQELNQPIDMDEALKYPLSEVPLSIAHADGSRRKTNKSLLYDVAFNSSQITTTISEGKSVYILDLAAQIRSIVSIPETFEELALKIYKDIPQEYDVIYIACDTYRNVSIKSPERQLRGDSNKFLIRSNKVKVPPNFQRFLNNGDNKERLFSLIEETWVEMKVVAVDKDVYFARGSTCSKIKHNSFQVMELETNHEEGDTKIAYLVKHAISVYPTIKKICIRSCSGDIDIPVILIGAFGELTQPSIFVDNGTGKYRKNVQIDNCELSRSEQKALVGFHAFTGNDYVSSFLRKTKKTWKTHVLTNNEHLTFFNVLGENEVNDQLHRMAERFVCCIYGDKTLHSVDRLRSKLFRMKFKKRGKAFDLSLLPPCSSTLKKHTTRANYISKIWKKAKNPLQDIDHFSKNGWSDDGKIDWIDEAFPSDVQLLFIKVDCVEKPNDEDDESFEDVNILEDEQDNETDDEEDSSDDEFQ